MGLVPLRIKNREDYLNSNESTNRVANHAGITYRSISNTVPESFFGAARRHPVRGAKGGRARLSTPKPFDLAGPSLSATSLSYEPAVTLPRMYLTLVFHGAWCLHMSVVMFSSLKRRLRVTRSSSSSELEWDAVLQNFASQLAESYEGNPHNLEYYWRAVFEAAGRLVAQKRPLNTVVDVEHDLYLMSANSSLFTTTPESTLDYDKYTVMACRPDLVIGHWVLRQDGDKKMVKEFVVVVIIELKRAPSRSLVDAETGRPYNAEGSKAIRLHLRKAQRQGARQASLYLRTPAAKDQRYVWVIAGEGPLTVMACATRSGKLRRVPDETLLSQLSDERREDDEVEKRDAQLDDRPRLNTRSQLPIPKAAADAGGLTWGDVFDGRRGTFGDVVTRLLEEFENDHPALCLTVASEAELHDLDKYM